MISRRAARATARAGAVSGIVATMAFWAAGTASAHVETDPNQAAQGAETAFITFTVPNEETTAGVVSARVNFPADHPLAHAVAVPLPGWSAQVNTAVLPAPVQQNGTEVTQAVDTITWTAAPGTTIAPGTTARFSVLAGPIPDNTDRLIFAAAQTYSNGDVVRWDQPPPAPGAGEPEHPAPVLTLVAASPALGPADTAAHHDTTARALGIAGLLAGVTGLAVAAITGRALRRRTRSPANLDSSAR